jgi:predicted DCC family thiol-disulfide oxidoreductase YuxK
MKKNDTEYIVFFDGICNLCHGAVRFILRHDKKSIFRFASLQSEYARQTLGGNIVPESLVYLEQGTLYYKSTGALRIARHLRFFRYFYYLIYVPKGLRDLVYDLVARYRYTVFGRKDHCPAPEPEWKDRFIA